MAEEIKQVIGFDVSTAIDALKLLDTNLNSLSARLDSVASNLSAFNNSTAATVAGLNSIARAAGQASDAMQRVSASTGKGAGGGGLLTGKAAADAFNNLLGGGGSGGGAGAGTGGTKADAEALIATMTRIQNQAPATAASLNQVGGAATQAFQTGGRAAAGFAISFETLARVVATQFIVRALSQLREGFRFAVESAAQFQEVVARIQTIAPGESFGRIAEGVRSISDNFNIPLLQAAEGVYQAVSNQVGTLTESLQFEAKAAQFATATHSTLKDSTDLLSGAIKSFGLSLDDTDKVSGIFFTAIDKGRITADQLANTFGRVGPSAANIGITLEELAGGIAAISTKGVNANESMTQFRGVITALTKPTEAMKNAMTQLGFATVEEGVATLRLDGLLDALRKNFGANAQVLAELFPNIRGIGGELALTGDNLKVFADDIRSGAQATNDLVAAKAALVQGTDAFVATKAINELKNAIIVDFGQAALKMTADLVRLVGGMENLISIGRSVVPITVAIVAGLAATTAALYAARVATFALTSAFGPLGLAMAAISAAPVIVHIIEEHTIATVTQGFTDLEKRNAEAAANISKTDRDSVADFKKKTDERVQNGLVAVQQINKDYLGLLTGFRQTDDLIVANTTRDLGRLVKVWEKSLQDIENAVVSSRNQVRDNLRSITDLQQQQKDLRFDFDLSQGIQNPGLKVDAIITQSRRTAQTAEDLFNKAFATGDKQLEAQAQALFQNAQGRLQEAKSVAGDNRVLQQNVFDSENALIRQKINLLESVNQKQRSRQTLLLEEKDAETKTVSQLREQAKIAISNTGTFNKKTGQPFSPDQLAKRDAARQAAFAKIVDLGFNDNNLTKAQALGLTQFLQKIQDDLKDKPIRVTFNAEQAIQKLRTDLKGFTVNIDVKVPFLKDLEDAVGKTLRNAPSDITKATRELGAEANRLRELLSQQQKGNVQQAEKGGAADALQRQLDSRAAQRASITDTSENATNQKQVFEQAFQQAKSIFDDLKKGKQFTEEQVKAFQALIGSVKDNGILSAIPGFGGKGGNKPLEDLKPDLALLGLFLSRISELQAAQKATPAVPKGTEERLDKVNSVLQSIGQAPTPALDKLPTTTGTAASNVSIMRQAFSDSAISVADIEARLQNISSKAAVIGGAGAAPASGKSIGGLVQGFAKGGFVSKMSYFDAGGAAKGTDTVPAMLSPNEFVVNASSTKKFFSQIQAINAGVQPSFNTPGASVTNVGDINVKVEGGASGRATGREIASELRRELRRGTSRL